VERPGTAAVDGAGPGSRAGGEGVVDALVALGRGTCSASPAGTTHVLTGRRPGLSSALDRVRPVKQTCHVESEVRRLRTAKGLSQGELADLLGVSRQTINAIETGRYDPSLTLAARLARHFGLHIEEIFHVEGD
jgi:putative transcriptional regulator